MERPTKVVKLSNDVEVVVLDEMTARIRFAFTKIAGGAENMKEGAIDGISAMLPMIIVEVKQSGENVNAKDLFEWILDNTQSIDDMIAHASELIGKSNDPNAQGSTTSPEKVKESLPKNG